MALGVWVDGRLSRGVSLDMGSGGEQSSQFPVPTFDTSSDFFSLLPTTRYRLLPKSRGILVLFLRGMFCFHRYCVRLLYVTSLVNQYQHSSIYLPLRIILRRYSEASSRDKPPWFTNTSTNAARTSSGIRLAFLKRNYFREKCGEKSNTQQSQLTRLSEPRLASHSTNSKSIPLLPESDPEHTTLLFQLYSAR